MYHVHSPGRVNLVGGHTDYSGGYALPVATDLATTIDAEPASDVTVTAEAMDETRSFGVADPDPAGDWTDYVRGCYAVLQEEGYDPGGFDGTIGGDLPIGSGLSSSASLTVGVMALLASAYDLDLSREQLARLARQVEKEFVGVDCGLLDQLSVALGKRDQALFLDLGTESYNRVPVPTDCQFVVVDTGVERTLSETPYGERRATVRSALETLGVEHSPSVDLAALGSLPEKQARRLGYVIRENTRVRQAATALDDGELQRFGDVLVEAHEDLASEFDASTAQLDWIVEYAVENGAYGARVTGAGWGGSAVVAADTEQAPQLAADIEAAYDEAFPETAKTFLVDPADGVLVSE